MLDDSGCSKCCWSAMCEIFAIESIPFPVWKKNDLPNLTGKEDFTGSQEGFPEFPSMSFPLYKRLERLSRLWLCRSSHLFLCTWKLKEVLLNWTFSWTLMGVKHDIDSFKRIQKMFLLICGFGSLKKHLFSLTWTIHNSLQIRSWEKNPSWKHHMMPGAFGAGRGAWCSSSFGCGSLSWDVDRQELVKLVGRNPKQPPGMYKNSCKQPEETTNLNWFDRRISEPSVQYLCHNLWNSPWATNLVATNLGW